MTGDKTPWDQENTNLVLEVTVESGADVIRNPDNLSSSSRTRSLWGLPRRQGLVSTFRVL